MKLELGGKGAAVVFDDVDVADTAAKLVGAITFHTGPGLLRRHALAGAREDLRPVRDECVRLLKQVSVGYQMDAATQMGPVVNEKQRKRVLGYLERGKAEGAEAIVEGGAAEVPGKTATIVKPALMEGTLDNVAAREEIFGPVAYLAPFQRRERRRSRW